MVLWERAETVLAAPWAEMKKFFNVFLFEKAKPEVGSYNGIVVVNLCCHFFCKLYFERSWKKRKRSPAYVVSLLEIIAET